MSVQSMFLCAAFVIIACWLSGCGGSSSSSTSTTSASKISTTSASKRTSEMTSSQVNTTHTMSTSSISTASTLRTTVISTTSVPPTHASTTSPSGPYLWKTNPIEVRGQHLYDSVTGKTFFGKGIAFPNLGDDVAKWIATLQRIKELSSEVNLIRIYTFPACIWDSRQGYCFKPFMQEADRLGVYVLVAGTGGTSGYLPITGFKDANECYSQGKVLNFGRAIVQRFYYPNTLGIVIGNEFLRKTTWADASVLKAYARDLKKYMRTCLEDTASPSHSQMRQIPLVYASNDDYGDALDPYKGNYLFCGNSSISIDIFGLNVERWCDPNHHTAYDSIQNWVSQANWPGAFLFTEMGCPEDIGYKGARDWAQVRSFFANFPHFDGFSAYAYWNAGATDFNMFDSGSASATENQDGKNFFEALEVVGKLEDRDQGVPSTPSCQSELGPDGQAVQIEPLENIKPYDDDQFPASECPMPWSSEPSALLVA